MEQPPAGGSGDVVLAVDIGGTKIAVGAIDFDGKLLWSRRAATPTGLDPATMWSTVEGLVASAPDHWRYVACGCGCGGPMSRGGEVVSPLNIPAWRDFPLRQRLAELTGLPTAVDNDAKALALGEGWVGSAAGESDYLSMVVSTGVGGGIVLDGRLLDGREGNAGHIGHVIVEPEGRVCTCGARGCLEAEASGTAIQVITGRPAADAGPDVVARTGRLVGRAVADVASLLDLRLVTVSGSVALGFGGPFIEAARRELAERAKLSFSARCRITLSALAETGPILGAAAVGWRLLGVR